MTEAKSPKSFIWFFGMAIFTLTPSFDTALKYFGPAGVAAYFATGALLLYFTQRFVFPRFPSIISNKTADYLAIATFGSLLALAFFAYPIASSGTGGGGSDADEALITAVNELLHGRYPYYLTTYLGNLISPMPGSVLLAIPFVVVGFIQLQNVFWLAIFYIVFRHYEESSVSAVGLLWTLLIFSPTLLQNIVTGADYATNTIFVLVPMWILVRTVSSIEAAEWKRILPAIFLGVALSSRSTFVLLMPLFLSILVQNSSWRVAIKYLSISAAAFLAVTLPFWLYDPAGFAPLAVQATKLKAIEDFLPFASVLIPGSAIVLSIFLSVQKINGNIARFFLNCAIVQLYVLMLTSLVYTLKYGQLNFFLGQAGYGMFTLFFGSTACWILLFGKNKLATVGENSSVAQN